MTTVRDETLSEDVCAVVRDAAAALPPGGHQLRLVAPRRRAQRRRTATLTMALAGVAALAVAVAVPLALRPWTAPERAAAPADAPAQRMFASSLGPGIAEGIRKPATPGGEGVGVRAPAGLVEIMGDGTTVVHDNPDLDMMLSDVAGLPDGGLVAFGAWDRSEGATKPDGTAVMDMRAVLVVVGPDGQTRFRRDLGAANGTLRAVGFTGDAVYLLHGDRLARHELATGREFNMPAGARIRGYLGQGWELTAVGGGRAVLQKDEADGVYAKVVNLDGTGGDPADVRTCDVSCHRTSPRLSPDGRHIAYTFWARNSSRLIVTDLTTGRQVVERDFDGRTRLGGLDLMGWADDHTLRLGLVVPPEKDGTYDLKDVLHVETVTV
ncbi:hypothetical protein WEI85_20510 [Actinomycetes bacterium KLBMP 9797]